MVHGTNPRRDRSADRERRYADVDEDRPAYHGHHAFRPPGQEPHRLLEDGRPRPLVAHRADQEDNQTIASRRGRLAPARSLVSGASCFFEPAYFNN